MEEPNGFGRGTVVDGAKYSGGAHRDDQGLQDATVLDTGTACDGATYDGGTQHESVLESGP